ncbi:MAG: hypothetical protein ACM3ZT_04780 [Bacillota bacterium]
MSWNIEHSKSENLLRVTATGPVSTEDVHAQAMQSIDIIKREQLPGAVIDYSKAILEMPVVEIFKMPDMFDDLGLPRQTRMAVLLPSDPVNMHKYTFFDDTATNRGYLVKLFWEQSHALNWAKGIVIKRGPKRGKGSGSE